MGEGILQFYKQKIKKEWKFAFFSSFIIAVLVHLYKLVNTLPNHDSVYNYYSNQKAIGSGRWALSMAAGISSDFDLPWLNGLLCCVYIALAVVVIVALFRLKNPVLIVLVGALLAASPAVTETLFFNFTADAYLIAMFMAALAVYLSRVEEERWYLHVLSGVLICIVCGIYQAYVSFGLVTALCYFIILLLQGEHDRKSCWKWVLRQIIIYTAALVAYYGIWKLCMLVQGVRASDYQGIADVGKVGPGLLTGGLLRAMKSSILYFIQWNIAEHGISFYSVLSILFLGALIAGLVIACIKSGLYKKPWAMCWFVLACVAMIPFACIWHFTSPSIGYRPMMLTSLVMLFVLGAVIYERWTKPVLKNTICLLLVVIVFYNSIMANISYYYMNQCQQRTYAEGIEMMTRIYNLQEKYQIEEIAVVGNRSVEVTWEFFDEETGKMAPAGEIYILSALLETSLLMDHEHTIRYLRETYRMDIPSVGTPRVNEIAQWPEVREMATWPAVGSVAVVNGILVVKLAET